MHYELIGGHTDVDFRVVVVVVRLLRRRPAVLRRDRFAHSAFRFVTDRRCRVTFATVVAGAFSTFCCSISSFSSSSSAENQFDIIQFQTIDSPVSLSIVVAAVVTDVVDLADLFRFRIEKYAKNGEFYTTENICRILFKV